MLLSRSWFPSWDATNRASNASIKSRCRRKFCNDRGNRRRLGSPAANHAKVTRAISITGIITYFVQAARIRRVVTKMLRGQPCSRIRRTNRHGWFIRETANLPRLITRETFAGDTCYLYRIEGRTCSSRAREPCRGSSIGDVLPPRYLRSFTLGRTERSTSTRELFTRIEPLYEIIKITCDKNTLPGLESLETRFQGAPRERGFEDRGT